MCCCEEYFDVSIKAKCCLTLQYGKTEVIKTIFEFEVILLCIQYSEVSVPPGIVLFSLTHVNGRVSSPGEPKRTGSTPLPG